MKIEEIKTIVKLMSEHDLTEFKIEAEECNAETAVLAESLK